MIERILAIAIATSVLFGQFGRIELGNRLVNIYLHELGMIMWLVYQFMRFRFKTFQSIFHIPPLIYFVVWMVIGFIATTPQFTFIQNVLSALYPLRFILYVCFISSFTTWLYDNGINRSFGVSILYTFSVLLVGVSLLQYIFVKDLWSMYPYGWDPHQFRVFATYLDVYVAAAILGLLTLFWVYKKKYVLAGALLVCLALTFSRSAYIALFASLIVYAFSHKTYKLAVLLGVIFIGLIVIIPKQWGEGVNLLRTSTIGSRIADAKLGVQIWQTAPLEGHGYNHIRYVKEQMNLLHLDDRSHSAASFHSSYLIILAATGVIGLVLFIWTLYVLLHHEYARVYGVFLAVMALFDNVLLYGMVVVIAVLVVMLSRPLRTSR